MPVPAHREEQIISQTRQHRAKRCNLGRERLSFKAIWWYEATSSGRPDA